MSKLNTFGEKLMQVFNQVSLSESALREIENNALLQKGSSFLSSIEHLINGNGSILLKLNETSLCEVEGEVLEQALIEAAPTVLVNTLDADGQVVSRITQDTDIIVDKISSEIEIANLTNNVLAVITSISDSSDYTTIANGLRYACANTITSAGSAFSEFINRAILTTNSPFELRKLMIQATFPEPGEQIFSIPSMGKVTGTTGVALWFHSGVTKVTEALQSIKLDFDGVVSRAYNKYVQDQTLNASLTANGFRILGYQFSKLFTDPLIVPVNNYAHLGINNSYIDIGSVGENTRLYAALKPLLDSEMTAIAVPTLGATWYLSYDTTQDAWNVGMQKHIYDESIANRLYALASRQGNTLKDVYACYASNGVGLQIKDSGGSFNTLSQYNDYVYRSFRATEKLITLGLLLLLSDDNTIRDQYYQSALPEDARKTTYRWTNIFNGTSLDSDPNESTRLGLALASNNISQRVAGTPAFVYDKLTQYFSNLRNNDGICQHMAINGTLIGYMNVANDAIVESQITTRVTSVVIAAAVFASLLVTSKAIRNIKSIALNSQISAQRLIMDPNVDVDTARKAIIKANRLSKLAGSATSFTTGIATSGFASANASIEGKSLTSDLISATNQDINDAISDALQDINENIENVRKLIKP